MKRSTIIGLLAAGGVMVASGFAPIRANADPLQNNKNTMRNVAILGGVATVLGIAEHRPGVAIAGAVTAVAATSQFNRDQRIENDGYGYGWNGPRYHHRWDNGCR